MGGSSTPPAEPTAAQPTATETVTQQAPAPQQAPDPVTEYVDPGPRGAQPDAGSCPYGNSPNIDYDGDGCVTESEFRRAQSEGLAG